MNTTSNNKKGDSSFINTPPKEAGSKPGVIQMPSMALPKGGGAIKGMGETFKADVFTGAANYSIAIPGTAARGFEPQLSIDYSSGNGNGVFGMGFSLPVSSISIRTGKGIPRYDGHDIFMLEGSELVLKKQSPHKTGNEWEVFEYLPRVQGAFSLIQHFVKADQSESYWKITTTENTVSVFGGSEHSRIFNPDNPAQIVEWLMEQSTDAKGNRIVYTYKAENKDNVPDKPWEQNRSYNNKYLQKIQYGNYTGPQGTAQFAYELIFDYGEYELPSLNAGKQPITDPYRPVNNWKYRPDAFSSYDSGFEIRTCRLCYNIMLFHLFEDELGDPCLVKSVHIDYKQSCNYNDNNNPGLSLLSQATMVGYRRLGKKATDEYDIQQTPPTLFSFSAFDPPLNPPFKNITVNDRHVPGYLNNTGFQPVDLNGEGIAGLLYQEGATLYYCAPEGEGQYDQPEFPFRFPSDRDFANTGLSLTDLNGDGVLDLVVSDRQRNGYYLKKGDGDWQRYTPFKSVPTNIDSPAIEMAGLSNNGKTDALIVDRAYLTVYPSLGTDGYGPAVNVKKPTGFPSVKEGYLQQYVGFTDMMGDGLSHRVKIANGSVECWPDRGYGVFGEKITMGNAPSFGDDFDIARLSLADIDGSGTTDILYVQQNTITLYINHSGNYFSAPITIDLPEPYSAIDQVSFADINGNGTNCLVYTKAGPVMRHYYYDFTGEMIIDGRPQKSMKPYLLIEIDNNLGMANRIQYCSSTKFYLEDKRAGDPWVTRLPFPVQVTEKISVIDKINGACYTSSFTFHDGHYDPVEREFIGFGYVETWDTETYENSHSQSPYLTTKEENYVPPVYSRTWYHTGAGFDDPAVMTNYKAHFFKGDTKAYDFPDTVFDELIYRQDPDTLRQAWLALKGQVIRTEVYAADKDINPLLYQNPYTVTEANEKVFLYQEKGSQPYAVFLVVPRESIAYNYERNPLDPRVQQTFTLATDAFGNTLQSCILYLSRRPNNSVDFVKYPEQYTVRGTLALQRYVDVIDDFLFCQVPCEEQNLELAGILPDINEYFSFDGIKKQVDTIGLPNRSVIIPYGGVFTGGVQVRQITWSRQYFWNWANLHQNPVLGFICSPALLHHTEEAVFPKQFTIDTYDGRLIDEAGYTHDGYLSNVICTHGGYFYTPGPDNGYWWNKGLVQYYLAPSMDLDAPQTFYLPFKSENSFALQPLSGAAGTSRALLTQDPSLHVCTSIFYDHYYLFPVQLTEEIDSNTVNTQYAQMDYITGQPRQLVDINGNTGQVLFDPLGQVIVSSLFGTENDTTAGGMTLYPDGGKQAEYQDPGKGSFTAVINNPGKFLQGASTYYFYNLNAWVDAQQPVAAIQLVRNHYWQAPDGNSSPYCQVMISYTDGLGRSIEAKLKCTVNGNEANNIPGEEWQVTGRTVYNNKGKPCEQYLPYFTASPDYEDQESIPGPPPTVTHYDPLLRVIRIDTPKRFFSRVAFTPWEQLQYDEDDTILDSWFYQHEYPGNLTPNEVDAIKKAVAFYNTPSGTIFDNSGHPFLDVRNNLGNVPKNAFASLQTPVISSAAIWNDLILNGYLAPYPDFPELELHFLTPKFQPYAKGFVLHLNARYNDILQPIIDILKENCLTTYYISDISGRVLMAVDPRIYYGNIINNTSHYNFRYRYSMTDKDPVFIDSADAGVENPLLGLSAEKHLSNIFNAQLWTWSPRSYCQFILYDRLQRKTALTIKKITEPGPVTNYDNFNLVEVFTYGESCTGAAGYNLRGQLYQTKDLSGIVVNPSYTMTGLPLETTRQLLKDYKTPADWRDELLLLEDRVYRTAFTYNAIQQMLTQTTPDDSVTTNTYNQAGRLITVSVKFPGNEAVQSIIENIEYDANGQRTLLKNGNGIVTRYTYEETTLRLMAIKSTRPANGNITTMVQDIIYYYDPVGNITRTLDNTANIVFCNNQRINPLADYTYNALYQLVIATGRQHTGITTNTYQDNSPDSFKQCFFGPPPYMADANKLENYTERYTYDDSGNLVYIKHTASVTTSWSRDLAVEDYSNRLTNSDYDAAGNLRKLDIANEVELSYNCCEHLVKAGIIKRVNEPDDCDYYLYGSSGGRTRKVSEKMAQGGALTLVEDKIYLGNYEIKRNINVASGATLVTSERQTIRVMDDQGCVAIIYYTLTDTAHPDREGLRQCRFQMDNNIGSVCLEMDTNAQLISYEEYFPYGGTSIITGISQAEVKAKEYRYSGKERDDSTGLYYYGLRYYVPWQGRWLNPDPAGTVDGLNLYAFVGGRVIAWHDINGTRKKRKKEDDGKGEAVKKSKEEEEKEISKKDQLIQSLGIENLKEDGDPAPQGDTEEMRETACWNWALNAGKASPNNDLSVTQLFSKGRSAIFKYRNHSKKDETLYGGLGRIPSEFPQSEKADSIMGELRELTKQKAFKPLLEGAPKEKLSKEEAELQIQFMKGSMKIAALAAKLNPNNEGEKSTFTLHMQTVKGAFHTWEHWGIGVRRGDGSRSIIQTLPKLDKKKSSPRHPIKINTEKMWDPDHVEAIIGIDELLDAHYDVLLKK
ncbi:sugar-binding protein [Pseudoflavitalea sp. X16]|uniref:SpvB/TcaC N-terminal domain-containing protein n=1 Tax=Paraflavitalea devenefica TaxID=2716334 RepID=UPI00142262AC|nr:SpvB/TcaC N-terminal domain-containing protein [Paraflavitalea devenefica]NII29299.1 sugar-binding protein [Paraflavitalea devenefica]